MVTTKKGRELAAQMMRHFDDDKVSRHAPAAVESAINEANRNRPPVDAYPVGCVVSPLWHAGVDGIVVGHRVTSVLVAWPARTVTDGPDTYEIDAFTGEYDTGFLAGRYKVIP